jgi:hypothetical protein
LTDEEGNETVTGVVSPFNSVVSRMLGLAKEIRKIVRTISPWFNSLNNEQVNALNVLVVQSADSMIYLEELIADNNLALKGLISEIIDIVEIFLEQLTNLFENYTPSIK